MYPLPVQCVEALECFSPNPKTLLCMSFNPLHKGEGVEHINSFGQRLSRLPNEELSKSKVGALINSIAKKITMKFDIRRIVS